MIIQFKIKGKERKELAQAVSEIARVPKQYLGMPTCQYKIGEDYTITKDGDLEIADGAESENLLKQLEARGYTIPPNKTKLTIQIPIATLDETAIEKLNRIIENKGDLFKAALQTDTLEIHRTDQAWEFPWFTIEQDGDSAAYMMFVCMLCDFANKQKRINNKPETTDNPKYSLRCYLMRMGMIGNEYKSVRKVILRHLRGSSAFRKAVNNDALSE